MKSGRPNEGPWKPKQNAASLETNIYHFSSTGGFNKKSGLQSDPNYVECSRMPNYAHFQTLQQLVKEPWSEFVPKT